MGMSELSLEMGEWPPESPRPGSGEGVGGLSQRDRGCLGGGAGYGYLSPREGHLLTVLSHPSGPSSRPHQLLRMFFRQQDEIRRLKEELAQKDIRIRQLQLELKNLRNSPKNC